MKMLINGITLIALIIYSLLSHAPQDSGIKSVSVIQHIHKITAR